MTIDEGIIVLVMGNIFLASMIGIDVRLLKRKINKLIVRLPGSSSQEKTEDDGSVIG